MQVVGGRRGAERWETASYLDLGFVLSVLVIVDIFCVSFDSSVFLDICGSSDPSDITFKCFGMKKEFL